MNTCTCKVCIIVNQTLTFLSILVIAWLLISYEVYDASTAVEEPSVSSVSSDSESEDSKETTCGFLVDLLAAAATAAFFSSLYSGNASVADTK